MPFVERAVKFEGTLDQLKDLNDRVKDGRLPIEGLDGDALKARIWEAIGKGSTCSQRAFDKFITSDPKMLQVKERILKIAERQAPVLITGPTGTGKGLLAKSLLRSDERPFLVATCGGLARDLVASTFFGHVRGAFTGAITDRKGILEAAEDGIVFLDEIGDLPIDLQATLLHAIQENEVYPVGSVRPVDTHCRFVSATNYDLHERVRQGYFRRDLLARISVFHVKLTPLKDRPDDIEPIARALGYNGPYPFPEETMQAIYETNVRAIESAIERWKCYGAFD